MMFLVTSILLEQYKPLLLAGEGAPALLSILVKLNPEMNDEARFKDLAYYLSRDINAIKNEHRNINKNDTDDQEVINSAAVSHACCALVSVIFLFV